MPKSKGKRSGKSIRPAGSISATKMDSLLPKISSAIEQSGGDLTIDCSRVTAIDAVGIAMILRAHASCCKADKSLELIHVKDGIISMFEALGLANHLNLSPAKS